MYKKEVAAEQARWNGERNAMRFEIEEAFRVSAALTSLLVALLHTSPSHHVFFAIYAFNLQQVKAMRGFRTLLRKMTIQFFAWRTLVRPVPLFSAEFCPLPTEFAGLCAHREMRSCAG